MTRQTNISGQLLNDIADAVCKFSSEDVATLFNMKLGTVLNYTGYAKALYANNPRAEEIYCKLNRELKSRIRVKINVMKKNNEDAPHLRLKSKMRAKTETPRKFSHRKSTGRTSLLETSSTVGQMLIKSTPDFTKQDIAENKPIATSADLKEVLKVVSAGFETLAKLIDKL